MPTLSACPDYPELQRHALGESPQTAAELDQHVLHCERCAETLQELLATDSLGEVMRRSAAVVLPCGEAVEAVIAQASRLNPAAAEVCTLLGPSQAPGELGRLGPYRVLEILGTGGMGVVFRGEDVQLRRPVALKAMLPALAASATARQRFLREAQAAAALEHDHIVTIHQVSEESDVPFLVMELLHGETLEARLRREGRLPVTEVLRLGRDTARGLAAAHAKGLVHRDIKPSNLWLEAGTGRVKILDFGLARSEFGADLTGIDQVLGTPAYMSPEQARGEQVEQRSDLFSLGCVLYRLSAGRMPFRGVTLTALLTSLAVDAPEPVSRLRPNLPPALSELIMQLLAKDPAERPCSAQAVVEALTAVEQESTEKTGPMLRSARPQARTGRRRGLWVAVAAGLLLLIGGGVALQQVLIRIKNKDGTVTEIKTDGEVEVVPAGKRAEHGEPPHPRPAARSSPFDALRREQIPAEELAAAGGGDPDKAPADLVAVLGRSRLRDWEAVHSVAFGLDGKQIFSAAGSFPARKTVVWDASTGGVLRTLPGMPVSPDGRLVVGQLGKVQEAASGRSLLRLTGHPTDITHKVFSPDSQLLATTGPDRIVKLWDVIRNVERGTLRGHQTHVRAIAFHPTAKRLATGSADGIVKVWDLASGEEVQSIQAHARLVTDLAFSPDGKQLASGSDDRTARVVKVWDWATGQELRSLSPPFTGTLCVAFSPDGKQLAAGGNSSTVRIWQVETGDPLVNLVGHGHHVNCLSFSPDSQRLLVGDEYGVMRLWNLTTAKEVIPEVGHTSAVTGLALHPDGMHLVSAGRDGTIRVWDLHTRHAVAVFERGHPLTGLAFSADGKRLLTVGQEAWAQVFEPASVGTLLDRPLQRTPRGNATGTALSPDGKRLATGLGGTAKVWELDSDQEPLILAGHIGRFRGVAFSGDGLQLATADGELTIRVWDTRTGTKTLTLKAGTVLHYPAMVFSPDGKQLAAGGSNQVELWDTGTGQRLHFWEGSFLLVTEVAFSPDGRLLAATSRSGHLVVWDTRSAREVREVSLPGTINRVAFSPDGRHLVTGNGNGTMYVLRLPAVPDP